ncbi:CU044_5270 family protein [Streptomyces sp. NPDC003362]
MDEMTRVRELRAEAPRPGRDRLVGGRERLLRAARGGRIRRLRSDWRLAAIGAAAAIAAAAVIVPQVTDGRGERALPGAGPGYTVELGSAKGWLNDAADIVAAGPAVTARDGQWIHTETVETNTTDDAPDPQTDERLIRYADPAMENGKAGDDHSPREHYAFLKSLPDDPAQVRAKARAFFYATDPEESRTEHEYRALTAVISRSYVYDPEDLAKVYRALATVPGVRIADVVDAAGRDAIAVYREGAGFRDETLLDPDTRLYRGFRSVSRDGEVEISGARVTTRVVDGEDDRP